MNAPLPSQYIPECPQDFIGPAGLRASVIHRKLTSYRESGKGSVKLLLYGAPGSGKSRLANMAAGLLTAHPAEVEHVNGRNLTIETTRQWMESHKYQSILGGWTVKLVDEIDLATTQAQDLLLSYLDRLPDRHAIIATSNLSLDSLTERFQTRFQQMRVDLPTTEEISDLLRRRWKLPKPAADAIAVGSGGNVRAALLDAETYLDERACAAR